MFAFIFWRWFFAIRSLNLSRYDAAFVDAWICLLNMNMSVAYLRLNLLSGVFFSFFLSFPYHSAFFVFMNILETGLSHIKVKPDSSCREHTIRRFIDCRVLPTCLWFANGTRHPPTFKGKLFVRRRAYFCSGSRPLCPCRRASGPLAYFDK